MSDWRALLAPTAGIEASHALVMRVLRRHGHDLLVLPAEPCLAARALTLYPAQTIVARLVRWILRTGFQWRLPMPMARVQVACVDDSRFAAFLARVAGVSKPAFGILCGNPRSPAQRFILLVFDGNGEPAGVVKAAVTPQGRALVQREVNFLDVCSGTPGFPSERGRLSSPEVEAFALDFARGESASPADIGGLAKMVTSWIDPDRRLPLADIPMWRRLPLHPRLTVLRPLQVRPVIFHGDLAPWNVRVDRGGWTVLDWERGEKTGMPGWDWFHFEIQHALLVRHLSTPQLVSLATHMLARPEFRRYAEATGIAGREAALLLGYLHFAVEVLQPSEGRAGLEALRGAWESAMPAGVVVAGNPAQILRTAKEQSSTSQPPAVD